MNKFIRVFLLLIIACGENKDVKTKQEELSDATGRKIEQNSLAWIKVGTVPNGYKNGDIVFINSNSNLSSPISLATKSDYTHCAMFWNMTDGPKFFEANSGVEATDFADFLKDRKGSLLLVLRLKDRKNILLQGQEDKIFYQMRNWLGRDYDGHFRWNDDEMYCSELIYKLYKSAGIELCALKKLEEFKLESPAVQKELKKRYGDNIPYKELMIAPVDLIYSPLLDTIYYSK